jgi:eukaryotic-like serine/threonine-protein kinase
VTGTSPGGDSRPSSSTESVGRDAVAPVPARISRGGPKLRAGSPLTWRLFLTVAAVVATVLVAALVMLSAAAARTADVASARALERTTRLVAVLLDGREHGLMRGAQVFVKNPSAWPLLMERRPEDMLDLAIEAADRVGATWVQITDDRGVRLAKSDEPTAAPVSLSSSALIGGALDGTVTTGAGVTGDSLLFQAVAVPVVVGARVAGVLMAAQLVDSALAAQVKATTASDVVFYVTDTAGAPRIAASTLGRDAALIDMLRRVRAEAGDSVPSDSSSPGGAITRADVALGGDRYVGRGATLRSAGGDVLGGFVALRSRAAEMAPYVALRRWIVVAGLLGLAVAFGLAFLTARSVARPVLALADATRRAADGDYSAVVDVDSNDEVGELASAVRTMLADLREKEALVAVIRTPRAVVPALVGASAKVAAPTAASTLGDHAPGAASTETPLPVGPGRVLARRYAIAEQLGIGGSGVVYRAFDRELGEVIAVKTVRPDVLAVDATALERLKSEIRLARRISHRNVVRTHDLGEEGGIYFITMEYVTGTSLRELIDRREPLPTPAVVAIAKQLCRALEVAHEQGVIHRDIKPQNLMVQPDGTLKVMDFGVARLRERSHGLTSTGIVVGTPAYMAPEQLMDDPVDARVDIYAAGVVLYECLTGHRPVDGSSPHVLMARMLSSDIRPPHEVNPAVSKLLSAIVMRTLSKEPGDRPASAGELYELLAQVEE